MIRAHKRNETREYSGEYEIRDPQHDRTAIRIPGPIALEIVAGPPARSAGITPPHSGQRASGSRNPILGTRLAARPRGARTVVLAAKRGRLGHVVSTHSHPWRHAHFMHMDHGHVTLLLRLRGNEACGPLCAVARTVRSGYRFSFQKFSVLVLPDVVHLIRITDRNYLELVKAAKRRSVSSDPRSVCYRSLSGDCKRSRRSPENS